MTRINRMVLAVFAFLSVTMFSVLALAQDKTQDTQALWQAVLVTVLTGVFAIAAPIVSTLVITLLRKWNVKVEQDKVDWVVNKAIGYGEQWAKNKMKDGKPVTGPEVAKEALQYGNKLAAVYAPKLGGYLAELIEAKLGQQTLADGTKTTTNNTAANPEVK